MFSIIKLSSTVFDSLLFPVEASSSVSLEALSPVTTDFLGVISKMSLTYTTRGGWFHFYLEYVHQYKSVMILPSSTMSTLFPNLSILLYLDSIKQWYDQCSILFLVEIIG